MKKNRECIDIEALLVRAYREKRVHTLNAGAAKALGLTMPRGPGATFSADDKVDTSSFSARMAAEIRELQARLIAAPSSLIDLHDLVLSLPDFFVERGAGDDFLVWDVETAASMGHTLQALKEGSTIVQVARRGGRGDHREDLLPCGPVRRLTRITTSTLMVLNGSYGDRPDVPELVVVRQRPIYQGARKQAVGYEPEFETPLHAVIEARAAYAVWHAALGMLAASLADSDEYEVTGPSAPAEPWKNTGRILPSLIAPTTAPPRAKRKKVPRPTKEKSIVTAA